MTGSGVPPRSSVPGRCFVVGAGQSGASRVVLTDPPRSGVVRPTGSVVQELWRVQRLPASLDADGPTSGDLQPLPPEEGLSLRTFAIPPGTGVGAPPPLASSELCFLLVVTSGRSLLVLDEEEVELGPGDVVILPGSSHAWRNPFDEPCVIVTTVTRLAV